MELSAIFDHMGGNLEAVTLEHFSELGIAIRPQPHSGNEGELPPDAALVVAAIGYSGEKLRGDLVRVSSEVTIREWQAAMDMADTGIDPCDTLGEFANMLLGRFKAKLLAEGIQVWLSTPTVTRASRLVVAPPAGASAWQQFEGRLGDLRTRLHALFEPGFAPTVARAEDDIAVAGDALFF